MRFLILSLCVCLLTGCVVTHPLPNPPVRLNIVARDSTWYSWETTSLEVQPESVWVDHGDTTEVVVNLLPDDTKPRISRVVIMVRDYNPEKVSLEDSWAPELDGGLTMSTERIGKDGTLFTILLDTAHPSYPENYPFPIFQLTWRALSGQIENIDYQIREITYE